MKNKILNRILTFVRTNQKILAISAGLTVTLGGIGGIIAGVTNDTTEPSAKTEIADAYVTENKDNTSTKDEITVPDATDEKSDQSSTDQKESQDTTSKDTNKTDTEDKTSSTVTATPTPTSTTKPTATATPTPTSTTKPTVTATPTPKPTSTTKPTATATPTPTPTHVHTWVDITKTVNHPAVTEQQTVVVSEAWTEYIPVYDDIYKNVCNGCGADITGNEYSHNDNHMLNGEKGGWHSEWETVQTGTETVEHPAVTKTVTVTVSEAWTETVVTGQRCSGCGATK